MREGVRGRGPEAVCSGGGRRAAGDDSQYSHVTESACLHTATTRRRPTVESSRVCIGGIESEDSDVPAMYQCRQCSEVPLDRYQQSALFVYTYTLQNY